MPPIYPIVSLQSVSMVYHTLQGETATLEDFSLDVFPGEFIGIVGPSGCGKSTILSLIAGLIIPTSGKVLICRQPVDNRANSVGYMLQQDHLFPWRTIESNALLGLEIRRRKDAQSIKHVSQLLDTYGLSAFKKHFPDALSGGMRQRAALIRTLALEPEILLLDEPFSALDYQTRLAVSEDIGQIIRQESKTALLVTHDIAEAISMSDRVVVLSPRPARIIDIIDIPFASPDISPLQARQSNEFKTIFDRIWKELDIHVS